jgi:hypothetical protein
MFSFTRVFPPQHLCTISPQGQLLRDTHYDASLVDGFTLPFKIEALATTQMEGCYNVSCANLRADRCPQHEDLSVGNNGAVTNALKDVDLTFRGVDGGSEMPLGCFSPCKKLDFPIVGGGLGYPDETADTSSMYCCPTPPVSPTQCREGPADRTEYGNRVHESELM